jgi:hypothetical protein
VQQIATIRSSIADGEGEEEGGSGRFFFEKSMPST